MAEYIHKNKLIKIIDDAYSKHGDVLGISNYIKNAINNMPIIIAEEPIPDINPCPICGGKAKAFIFRNTCDTKWLAHIDCQVCRISLKHDGDVNDNHEKVYIDMVEKWNSLKERQLI